MSDNRHVSSSGMSSAKSNAKSNGTAMDTDIGTDNECGEGVISLENLRDAEWQRVAEPTPWTDGKWYASICLWGGWEVQAVDTCDGWMLFRVQYNPIDIEPIDVLCDEGKPRVFDSQDDCERALLAEVYNQESEWHEFFCEPESVFEAEGMQFAGPVTKSCKEHHIAAIGGWDVYRDSSRTMVLLASEGEFLRAFIGEQRLTDAMIYAWLWSPQEVPRRVGSS